ncbi:GNAT family N-acetyltransferase [Ideonella sp. 4Y11]|uniref:GNAT family N-acetyltransferase n=1 Tax=Ideonella aquatica TaxID=2824119 RepID=A0A940YK91_9BURK|nr:GNAT family N-acetyltransferase [Ideonella aquatica]MBQ0961074.1 GNAT family N-acetyltransferase [Ideonella aquatica]
MWLHTYCRAGINGEVAQYVLSALTPERFALRLAEADTRMVVAERDEWLLGFAVLKLAEPCPWAARSVAELQTLYVQEHLAGQGIGSQLLKAAKAQAGEASAGPLWLTVNAQNTRALRFYAHHGYTQIGTTHFVLGQGRHENQVLLGADTSRPDPHHLPAAGAP